MVSTVGNSNGGEGGGGVRGENGGKGGGRVGVGNGGQGGGGGAMVVVLANMVKYLDFENGSGGRGGVEGRLLSNSHQAMHFMVASVTVVW